MKKEIISPPKALKPEPVFGNIVSNIGLKRFSLRGKSKINAQWLLFTLVHNIGKIQKYGAVTG